MYMYYVIGINKFNGMYYSILAKKNDKLLITNYTININNNKINIYAINIFD